MAESDFSCPCIIGFGSSPSRCGTSRLCSLWPDMRSLRFRRVPFGRDGALDPGGATASRIAMPHILPSTVPSVSASATLFLSWLNPPPHPITVYASHPSSPTTAQHSLPGGALPSYRGRFFSPAGTHQRTGTEIPNPLPSSGESANLRFLRGATARRLGATTSTQSSCSMRQGDNVPDGRGCGADRGGTAHRVARARLPRWSSSLRVLRRQDAAKHKRRASRNAKLR